jgi:hypothetical protein
MQLCSISSVATTWEIHISIKILSLYAVKFEGPYRNILSICPRRGFQKMVESESVFLLFVGDINYRVYVDN